MGGVGDIIDHHAAATLQGNEGVDPAIHGTHSDTLRLGALLAGAVVLHSVVVGGVEVVGEVLGGEGLEVVAAGKDFLDAGVSDLIECERAAAEEIVLLTVQAVIVAGVEEHYLAGKTGVFCGDGAGGRTLALAEVHLFLIEIVAPLTAVALVGGEQPGPAVLLKGCDAVGHTDAHQAFIGLGVIGIIFFVDVHGGLAMVLKAGGVDTGEGFGCKIHHSDGVVLLESHIGPAAGDGDVFGFQVHGRGGVLLQDNAAGGQGVPLFVKGGEVHHGSCARGHIHHTDGALGVRAPLAVAQAGLALVGGEDGVVAGKGDHVGLYAHGDHLVQSQGTVGIAGEQGHPAGIGIALGLEGGGQEFPVGGDSYGGHVAVSKRAILSLYGGLYIKGGSGEGRYHAGIFQLTHGDDGQQAALAIDGIGIAVVAVVGHDLHDAAVHIELTGAVTGDLG